MANSLVFTKAYDFAIKVVSVYKLLSSERREFVLSKQLLRSGTAIGALISESEHAQSKADFLNKMNVALKEANETVYWLNLLKDTGFLSAQEYESIIAESQELVKILASIVKTTKINLSKK